MTKSSKLIQTELKWDESENEEKKAELKKNDSYGVKMSQIESKCEKMSQMSQNSNKSKISHNESK